MYAVASIYREIFAKAIRQFYSEDITPMETVNMAAVPATGTTALFPASTGGDGQRNDLFGASDVNVNPEVTSDLIDTLVDETSMSEFWETWGQLWVE